MHDRNVLWGLALIAGCDVATADRKGANVDPKADKRLHDMATKLAKAGSFQFDASHTLEAVTKDGQKLEFAAQSRVAVERPNKLRSDRIGPLADLAFYYDGKTMTLYGKTADLYATTPAPDNLDAAIDFARDKLGIDAPAADLLYADPYAALMEDVVSGTYIAKEPIGGQMCDHLAYREANTDWQIWIDDRGLPCRFVITSTDVKGSPEFGVTLSNWNLSPSLPNNEFTFTPPRTASQIEFAGLPRKKETP